MKQGVLSRGSPSSTRHSETALGNIERFGSICSFDAAMKGSADVANLQSEPAFKLFPRNGLLRTALWAILGICHFRNNTSVFC